MGLSVQLGHPSGQACINPEICHAGVFTILDTNGIHDVTLAFCNCETKQPHYIQLLRFGWFPATVAFPRTAFTLRLLKQFQILSFESKLTVYEYHQALQRLTDNTGTSLKRVCTQIPVISTLLIKSIVRLLGSLQPSSARCPRIPSSEDAQALWPGAF